jgi:hypothetical protein
MPSRKPANFEVTEAGMTDPRKESQVSQASVEATVSPSQSLSRVFLPWVACVGLLALTGLFIQFVGAGLEDDPRKALFGFLPIVVFALVGGLGVYLASRTGFPAAWDERIDNRSRFLYPLGLGAALGIVSVVLEFATGGIDFVLEETGWDRFNAPLPGSLLLYSAGAVILEVVYRLLPIPLILWLASKLGLPHRHRLTLFWVLAVVTSIVEPLGQTEVAIAAGRADLALSQFALSFVYNLVQAYWFLTAGFLAAINVRLGHYAIWHVLYGGIICAC